MPVFIVAAYNNVARAVSVMVVIWVVPSVVEVVAVIWTIPAVVSAVISSVESAIVPWIIKTSIIPRVIPSSIPWVMEPRVKVSVAAPIAVSPSVPIRSVSPSPVWTVGP